MSRALRYILVLLALTCGAFSASAQYYTWGSDAAGMKWNTIRTPDVRMIYPDTLSAVARRTLFYIRTIQPDISHGFRHGPMRIPFVMHPENFQSNGLVMYLPKRVEFLTAPAIDGYSMPWYKQLVAHEYRHAVQYNNLDRGVIRVLSYVLGQQGSTVGLLCMPIWAMEGDAVMSETAMSSFGRGMQPSFSMGYRAMGRIGRNRKDTRDRRNIDKWFCGSFREYIPDHYELGYQICSYTYERFGENVWDKVAWFGSRNPYMLATTRIALEKYYDTNVSKLFRETFDTLEGYWGGLPPVKDSAVPLTSMPEGNYTSYQWPLPLDANTVLVLKTDFDRPTRFVRLDSRSGEEELICHTGQISTRPAMGNRRVWWTEYRRSKLFEQRVNSQLCYMDLADGVPRFVVGVRNALYPTPAGDDIAWVEYNPNGDYSVVVRNVGGAEERFGTPPHTELHGLAWDERTSAYYVIVTDDSGMWLGRIGADGIIPVTAGAYITLSNLRAEDGKLYFGSIASGRDEAHCYDLLAGREYRITTSAYGSFMPVRWQDTNGDDRVLVSTYDKLGYHVAAQQAADNMLTPVAPSALPLNVINPERKRWDVVNLDTVRFTEADSLHQSGTFRAKRYRKVPNLVNVHSWMPVAFDPFDAVDEHNINLNLGVTLLSQNLLSNTEAYVSYGWNKNEGSLYNLGVRYFGLGVRFDLDASYGGNQLFYSLASYDPQTGDPVYQTRPSPDKYYSIKLSATLPLYFQRGYHTRQLSVSTSWNFSNGMVAKLDKIDWDEGHITNIQRIGFREGLHKVSFGIGYSDQVRMAHRDIAPRWGYMLSANYTFNPANANFSDLISFYGQVYLPGFAAHNSLKIAANYQTSVGGYKFPAGYAPLNYKSSRLIPRGFKSAEILSNNYTALSLDYQLPVWYPEGGIGSVLYFKRIRLNAGGDFAQFRRPVGTGRGNIGRMDWKRIWSVGGDIIFDVNVFRQPASATSTFKLSVYRPSSGGVWVTGSLGLPF
ncbi:hypothetical protein [uncultured Alistipes sp.]|jgi:hypothetical protein|uniref:hypothetical protein n=1 Tax=uncultured Alistipes sp. TaxID=538949 RepID=UPI0025D3B000|nr:hypothetical protein [uncultured Alistipes sp.]